MCCIARVALTLVAPTMMSPKSLTSPFELLGFDKRVERHKLYEGVALQVLSINFLSPMTINGVWRERKMKREKNFMINWFYLRVEVENCLLFPKWMCHALFIKQLASSLKYLWPLSKVQVHMHDVCYCFAFENLVLYETDMTNKVDGDIILDVTFLFSEKNA